MPNPNNFYTIYIDDKKFCLSKATLTKNGNSLLANIIKDEESTEYISLIENNIFIDRDPHSFSFILDMMRGYKIDLNEINDPILKKKIESDIEFYNINEIKINPEDILKVQGEKYEDLPLLDKLKESIVDTHKSADLHKSKGSIVKQQKDEDNESMFINLLTSNDQNKINDFMKDVDSLLKNGNPMELISDLSNNEDFKKIIKTMSQTNAVESDPESLDLNDDDATNELSESQLQTDISNNKIGTQQKPRIENKYIKIN